MGSNNKNIPLVLKNDLNLCGGYFGIPLINQEGGMGFFKNLLPQQKAKPQVVVKQQVTQQAAPQPQQAAAQQAAAQQAAAQQQAANSKETVVVDAVDAKNIQQKEKDKKIADANHQNKTSAVQNDKQRKQLEAQNKNIKKKNQADAETA